MANITAVFPYKAGSKSATALAQSLMIKTLKLQGSNFVPKATKVLLNWGSTTMPEAYINSGMKIINPPEKLRQASNKKIFFEKTIGNPDAPRVPPFTCSKEEAAKWFVEGKEVTIFARTVLAGHSGEGIVKVVNQQQLDAIPNGTLLCLYVPKRREFRIHCTPTKAFSIQEKKAKVGFENTDFQIRNVDNGFVFARQNLGEISQDVIDQALKALKMVELDFGAVDVIWNERKKEAYVLEVNTAPGLEGQTVEDYKAMLEEVWNAK